MNLLLAIDPGETTGVAVFDLDTQDLVGGYILDSIAGLEGIFKAYPPKEVVFEEFNRVHGSSGPHTRTMKLIGAIELLAVQNRAVCVGQANMVRKSYEPDASAHPLVQACPGETRRHVRDAVAHGMYYLNRRKMS